jgi:hypothetical protein
MIHGAIQSSHVASHKTRRDWFVRIHNVHFESCRRMIDQIKGAIEANVMLARNHLSDCFVSRRTAGRS